MILIYNKIVNNPFNEYVHYTERNAMNSLEMALSQLHVLRNSRLSIQGQSALLKYC